jgi:hypothetical protein
MRKSLQRLTDAFLGGKVQRRTRRCERRREAPRQRARRRAQTREISHH